MPVSASQVLKATAAHDQFYSEVRDALAAVIDRHGELSPIVRLAIIARTVGYSAAVMQPDQRGHARDLVQDNFDLGFADMAAMLRPGPSRPQ